MTTEETIRDFVAEMASSDFDCGHSAEDYDEFRKILSEDGVEATEELFEYYNEVFNDCLDLSYKDSYDEDSETKRVRTTTMEGSAYYDDWS